MARSIWANITLYTSPSHSIHVYAPILIENNQTVFNLPVWLHERSHAE